MIALNEHLRKALVVTPDMVERGARALGGYTAENGYTDEDWDAAGDACMLCEQAERVLDAALNGEAIE